MTPAQTEPREQSRHAASWRAAAPVEPLALARALSDAPDSLATLFRPLGHPIRVRIVLALADGMRSASELERRLDVQLALVAYHMRTLHQAGLVELVETRPRRGSLESFYHLTAMGQSARRLLGCAYRELHVALAASDRD
jgi:DNA-binding transcriptional ArsR family regulator